ncbi:MAG TPA: MEDS domain-containing protein [Usitatibacter sp.]|nr:MEDS domain-containing protein [Usitatibacter sp.]
MTAASPASSTTTSIRASSFWSNLRPREHLLQCYAHEDALLDALEGFVSSGLRAGDGVAVLATATHLHELEKRLRAHWLDIDRARWEQRYNPLLAQEVLEKFMDEDGLPDEERFRAVVDDLLATARGTGRKVRFFGEMVNVLWARGDIAGSIQLENLWCGFLLDNDAQLFCAYARELFGESAGTTLRCLRDLHTMVLPG